MIFYHYKLNIFLFYYCRYSDTIKIMSIRDRKGEIIKIIREEWDNQGGE